MTCEFNVLNIGTHRPRKARCVVHGCEAIRHDADTHWVCQSEEAARKSVNHWLSGLELIPNSVPVPIGCVTPAMLTKHLEIDGHRSHVVEWNDADPSRPRLVRRGIEMGTCTVAPEMKRPHAVYIDGHLVTVGKVEEFEALNGDRKSFVFRVGDARTINRMNPRSLSGLDDVALMVQYHRDKDPIHVRGKVALVHGDGCGGIRRILVHGEDRTIDVNLSDEFRISPELELQKQAPALDPIGPSLNQSPWPGEWQSRAGAEIDQRRDVAPRPGESFEEALKRKQLERGVTYGPATADPGFRITQVWTRDAMLDALKRGRRIHAPDCLCQHCDACAHGLWLESEANRWLDRRGREHAGVATGLWAVTSGKRTHLDDEALRLKKAGIGVARVMFR